MKVKFYGYNWGKYKERIYWYDYVTPKIDAEKIKEYNCFVVWLIFGLWCLEIDFRK